MPDVNNRTTENEFAKAILEILYNNSQGELPVRDLIKQIPKHIMLTKEDQQQSATRGSEKLWEQRVRNIQPHHGSPGNYIYAGFLSHVRGGLRITEAGRKRYEHTH